MLWTYIIFISSYEVDTAGIVIILILQLKKLKSRKGKLFSSGLVVRVLCSQKGQIVCPTSHKFMVVLELKHVSWSLALGPSLQTKLSFSSQCRWTIYECNWPSNNVGFRSNQSWKEQKPSEASSNKREMKHIQGRLLGQKGQTAARFQRNLKILSHSSISCHLSGGSLFLLLSLLSLSDQPLLTNGLIWPLGPGPESTRPNLPYSPAIDNDL